MKERKEVNGTPSNLKCEYIALYMEDNGINIYLRRSKSNEQD
jgi:hypothetical protein